MDKISIILPIYNCERFIGECLDSIKKQTINNFEVIIIDDCSTDSSSVILQKYANEDSRFIYFRNEKNMQISACRNLGIKRSTGNYIFFVDSDDVLDSRCLEMLYTSLKDNEADVSICSFAMFKCEYIFDNQKMHISVLNNKELMKEIALCNRIQNFAWGKLFKKELFNGVVFPEGRIYEDVYVIPALLGKARKCSFVENTLYFYRQNQYSLSKTLNLCKIQNFFLSMEEKGKLYSLEYPDLLSFLSQSYFELFYLLKQHKIKKRDIPNYKSVKLLYKKAVRNAPLKQKIKYLIAVL